MLVHVHYHQVVGIYRLPSRYYSLGPWKPTWTGFSRTVRHIQMFWAHPSDANLSALYFHRKHTVYLGYTAKASLANGLLRLPDKPGLVILLPWQPSPRTRFNDALPRVGLSRPRGLRV